MAMNPGRPTDPIWEFFTRRNDLGTNKAQCKKRDYVMTCNAERMKKHYQNLHEDILHAGFALERETVLTFCQLSFSFESIHFSESI